MRKCIILFLITGIIWAQTDFDKLVLKNGLEFYFILSYEPTIPKNMIPQQKMWAGCYRLLPPTQKRSEFGPWQSLSRDVLVQFILKSLRNVAPVSPFLNAALPSFELKGFLICPNVN